MRNVGGAVMRHNVNDGNRLIRLPRGISDAIAAGAEHDEVGPVPEPIGARQAGWNRSLGQSADRRQNRLAILLRQRLKLSSSNGPSPRRFQHQSIDVHIGLIPPKKPAVVAAHSFAQCRRNGRASGHAGLAVNDHRPDLLPMLLHELPDFIRLLRSRLFYPP